MGNLITSGWGPGGNTIVTNGLGYSAMPERVQVIPLITEQDGFEVVLDKIVEILAFESTSQQEQAVERGLDPTPWRFGVYKERQNHWDRYRGGTYRIPTVHVEYDKDYFDKSKSNSTTRQTTLSRYHVDCYAVGVSAATDTGHVLGDKASAIRAFELARIVRRILMHPKYDKLGLYDENFVWGRWLANREKSKPTNDAAMQHVTVMRLVLDVEHNETFTFQSPHYTDLISTTYRYEPDGQVVAELRHEVLQ